MKHQHNFLHTKKAPGCGALQTLARGIMRLQFPNLAIAFGVRCIPPLFIHAATFCSQPKCNCYLFFALATCVATLHGTVQAADATNTNPKAPAQAVLKVADFDKGKLTTLFDTSWIVFTDSTLAGKSSLNATLSPAGADHTEGAMLLTGKLTPDFQYGGFAGVTARLLEDGGPTNLTRFTGVQFQARGDGKSYRVAIGKDNVKDSNHFFAEFRARPEWTLIKVPFSDLAQSPYFGKQVPWSADNITAVAFMAVAQPEETREFKLEIDTVSFY